MSEVYAEQNGQLAFPVVGLNDKAKETYLDQLRREKFQAKYDSDIALEKITKQADFFKKLSDYLKKLDSIHDNETIRSNLVTAEEKTNELLNNISEAMKNLKVLEMRVRNEELELVKMDIDNIRDSEII